MNKDISTPKRTACTVGLSLTELAIREALEKNIGQVRGDSVSSVTVQQKNKTNQIFYPLKQVPLEF